MKVEFLAKFDKDLDKLTSQRVKDDIISAIENVEQAQKIADIQNIKKLKGAKIAHRIYLYLRLSK